MSSRVFMASVLCLSLISCSGSDDATDKASTVSEATEDTIEPGENQSTMPETPASAKVTSAAPAEQVAAANTGESVYNRACAGCHMTGAAGAPRIGDKAAWADRISKGADALVKSAIDGVPGTAMLARGTCNACSDDDLKLAVNYMISQGQ
jgi:cytochrome c5